MTTEQSPPTTLSEERSVGCRCKKCGYLGSEIPSKITPNTKCPNCGKAGFSEEVGVIDRYHREIADLRARLQTAEQQLADTQKEFGRIQGTSAKQVVDRFLDLMRKLNEKDLPAGFESWEAFLKHIDGISRRAVLAEQQLGNLLARIHRDGGHYQDEHGTEKSVHDAEIIIARLLVCEDEKASVEQHLAQVMEALRKVICSAIPNPRDNPMMYEAWSEATKYLDAATPSDGCGKGRVDGEPDCVCRDCGHIHFWHERIVTDGGTFCPKPRCFSAQYNKRIVAASSSGEEGK